MTHPQPPTKLHPYARVSIRCMVPYDLPEVIAIDTASFAHPWTEDDFLERRRERNCIGMVADHGKDVVGYMLYRNYPGSIHISRFAVHPNYRGHHVGRQMVGKLKSKLSEGRRTDLTLDLRESNRTGWYFWRAMGFRGLTVIRDHYEDDNVVEDAYVMQFSIGQEVI